MTISSIADSVPAKAASVATFGGSAGAIFGGINNWNAVATIGGLLIGVAGFLLNWYFKAQHLELARARLRVEFDEDDA